MYGIMRKDGKCVLHYYKDSNSYGLKRWERASNLVMRESAREITHLMEQFMNVSNQYDLEIFQFTQEQLERVLIRKLSGII